MAGGWDPNLPELAELARREMRATLFPGVFRQAVADGRANEADRDLWREMYLADPEAFDFATAFDFVDAGAEVSTPARRLHLEETLRHPKPGY